MNECWTDDGKRFTRLSYDDRGVVEVTREVMHELLKRAGFTQVSNEHEPTADESTLNQYLRDLAMSTRFTYDDWVDAAMYLGEKAEALLPVVEGLCATGPWTPGRAARQAEVLWHPYTWVDRQGDVWSLGRGGLLVSHETKPFPREYVEKKWGPLRPVRDTTTNAARPEGDDSSAREGITAR